MTPLGSAGWIVVSYLLGTVSFSFLLVKRLAGIDLRQQGSGNLGATNAGRVLGKRWAVVIYVLDLLKGLTAAGLPRLAFGDPSLAGLPLDIAAGFAVILGHVFPFWLGFRGGKGVATGSGVVLALGPVTFLGALVLWIVMLKATRMVSAASVLATASLPLLHRFVEPGGMARSGTTIAMGAMAVFVIVMHRSNIRRILAGTEHRVGARRP